MEKKVILYLNADTDINLEIEPISLQDEQFIYQNNDESKCFSQQQYSNPLTENNSGLLSISSQNEQNEVLLDDRLEIQNLLFSAYSFIGGKKKMQDKITIKRDDDQNCMFFGIYDGFGDSAKISQYLSEQLHNQLQKNPYPNYQQKIPSTFKNLHLQIMEQFSQQHLPNCGSTALFSIVTDNELIIANLGDSRALLLEINDQDSCYYQITTDHSATYNNAEIARIEKMVFNLSNLKNFIQGGFVFDLRGIKRVQGELAVTRAFTNNLALQKFVAIEPEINVIPLDKIREKGSKFKLIMASDGLWNVFFNKLKICIRKFLIKKFQIFLKKKKKKMNINKKLI